MIMQTINDIFKTYSAEYIERYVDRMPKQHLKVIKAINHCRTPDCGTVVYTCRNCGRMHTTFCSCGNRHCPSCQYQKSQHWLEKQFKRQLPGHHFMITFTLPQELRDFIRSHQRKGYDAMFAASAGTLKTFAQDDRWAGGDLPGFFGVLHTWGRQLPYHPHIHYVVPGGALSTKDGKWHPTQKAYFAPVKALSNVYKAKFIAEIKKAGLYDEIDPMVWQKPFIVHSRTADSSRPGIKYLEPYVFKVAISNHRIVKVENDRVFFRYKKTKSNRWRTMSLAVMEFMHRFLQHVLPSGFMKVRYYGFLSPGSSVDINDLSALIEKTCKIIAEKISIAKNKAKALTPCCPDCKGRLVFKCFVPPMRPEYMFGYG
jgi:hypothetical protein